MRSRNIPAPHYFLVRLQFELTIEDQYSITLLGKTIPIQKVNFHCGIDSGLDPVD